LKKKGEFGLYFFHYFNILKYINRERRGVKKEGLKKKGEKMLKKSVKEWRERLRKKGERKKDNSPPYSVHQTRTALSRCVQYS
jgi:hypothetical protein